MRASDASGTNRRTVDTTKPNPAAKFWRKPAVCVYTGLSPSTVDRRIEAKDFPAPVRLGPNTIAWLSDEVRTWAASRIAARDQVAA